jgi:hypothetical protein
MDEYQALLTAGIGVIGIIIGLFLRPLVEGAFERKRKTLHFETSEAPTSIGKFPMQGMRMSWHGHEFEEWNVKTFNFYNRTGRTLRGVELKFFKTDNETQNEEKYKLFDCVFFDHPSAPMDYLESENNWCGVIIEHLPPKCFIRIDVVDTFSGPVSVISPSDIELAKIDRESRYINSKVVENISAGAAAAAIAAALASMAGQF